MAARICPQCRTRVDERRARQSPWCLTCGGPLGAPAPAFASGTNAARQSSPLPWILGALGLLALLGLGLAGMLFVFVIGGSGSKPTAQVEPTNLPAIESAATPPGAAPRPPTPPPTPSAARPKTPRPAPSAKPPPATSSSATPGAIRDPFAKKS